MEDRSPEFVKEIERLVMDANASRNKVVDIDGRPYDADDLKPIIFDPRPQTIETASLSSIADFVTRKIEGVELNKLFIHVVSPTEVELLGEAAGEEQKRTLYMRASTKNDLQPFKFDFWYEQEAFLIALMSLFEETEDRTTILKVASMLVSESKFAKTDNGATSKLQINAGVINTNPEVQDKDIPYVCILKPFRTFREVSQPQSAFVFRYKAAEDAVVLKLFEADGGAWKHDAMVNIAEYFKAKCPELRVLA